jgi:DNA-binding MarR family transcriptional regulator
MRPETEYLTEASEFTLTEARVLYELANCDDSTVTRIAGELGIDLGYLSRLIKKFARRRYIKRKRSPVDARQNCGCSMSSLRPEAQA